jgi:hypothetical protein
MDLSIDITQLNQATREVMDLPGLFNRARISAMKSTGWMIRTEMRAFIESGGAGSWPGLHPVSRFYAKKYKTGIARWIRPSAPAKGPMFWLGKHARYRVTDNTAMIGFGRSAKGETGTLSPFLMHVLDRAERGEKTTVTGKARRFFGATRRSNRQGQEPGTTFFPLKKDTTTLETEKRPVFEPVLARIEAKIAPYYEDKFWTAVNRYRQGVKTK